MTDTISAIDIKNVITTIKALEEIPETDSDLITNIAKDNFDINKINEILNDIGKNGNKEALNTVKTFIAFKNLVNTEVEEEIKEQCIEALNKISEINPYF